MYEIFDSLYLIDWIHSVISILITSLGTSLFLRLFLLRDFVACFACPPTAVMPDLYFIFLLVGAYLPYLLSSRFYRWAEMSDISPCGPYYKGSGTSEPTSERSLPRSSLRPLRGSAIHSSAASPFDSYGAFFIPFIHDVREIGFIMSERLNSIHSIWLISILIY